MATTATLGITPEEVARWPEEFQAMWVPIGGNIRRRDARSRVEQYICGLLGRIDRKNGWQVAEYTDDSDPPPSQSQAKKAAPFTMATTRYLLMPTTPIGP